jgi:hypothetical protein
MSYDTEKQTFTGTPAKSIRCWCSLEFAIPRALHDHYHRRHEEGEPITLYCPLGHGFVPSGTSASDRLRNSLRRTEEALEAARRETQHQVRRVRAQKGQMTKLRKRVANGICPCCTRTFANLARHMASQHPEWNPDPEAPPGDA